MQPDTIFALSSGSPPAAISIIRVSGPGARKAAELLAGGLPPAREAAVRQLRDPRLGQLLDDALVLRFDGPASSTGEDVVELHCHGGRAVVAAVLGALGETEGLREAQPGEFTRRAFENGRIDLTEAEGLADLIEAETESQRRAALIMAEGGLRQQIDVWQARVLELSARAETAIDYVDEDSGGKDRDLSSDCGALAIELGKWLDRPRSEPLREGVRVVIAGPPNAGKSSLLNAIVGYDRAIVTDVPGTTRDHIEVPLALAGVPMRLIDTAGLRESAELVEKIGVDRAHSLIGLADVLVWLGEPGDAPEHARLVRVHARCDLPGRGPAPTGSIAVSAKTGEGLARLTSWIADEARSLLPGEGEIALNRRQADCVAEARGALRAGGCSTDVVLVAESLRQARLAFDRLTGAAGVEDLLDTLFARFCLGK
ncbi:MAG TPA: tRNA uridine-5-carboxymethylaminomethyl(34) synthesis GTPase MnmE [Sphingomicrobium sp.]|nr:tRNA uridine-5-carboxymethylaminomethyl(34) synthesis GTPase MnmE [Sphingomicrobium sp.]